MQRGEDTPPHPVDRHCSNVSYDNQRLEFRLRYLRDLLERGTCALSRDTTQLIPLLSSPRVAFISTRSNVLLGKTQLFARAIPVPVIHNTSTSGEANDPDAPQTLVRVDTRDQRNQTIYQKSGAIDWFAASQLLRNLFLRFLRLVER